MKVKLLRKLRHIGKSQVTVYSVTRIDGVVVGMKYGYPDQNYSGMFNYGDTVNDVKEKACSIWLSKNIDIIRKTYYKHSIKHKKRKQNYGI